MIVIAKGVGRLANRLVLFAHFIGTAIEHGFVVVNPAFRPYARYFPSTTRDLFCRFPPGRAVWPPPGGRRLLHRLTLVAGGALHRLQIAGWDVGLIRLRRDQRLDLEDPAFLAAARRHRLLFVQDWFFRSARNCERHREVIRAYDGSGGDGLVPARSRPVPRPGLHLGLGPPGARRRAMRAVRRWLRAAAAPLRKRVPHRPVVYNANGTHVRLHRRAALLVYMPEAFRLLDTDPAFLRHQNLRRCRQMAGILGEFGYRVDVVSKWDTAFHPASRYDLVISECIDWQGEAGWFHRVALRVFLTTTMPPGLHNEHVRRRHHCLVERRPCRVARHRGYVESMPALHASHALVGVGNSHTMSTWAPMFAGPIHPFDTQALEVPELRGDPKDVGAARRHFLFLASRPQLHKGLDLLLEVFPQSPDLHLYVCSDFRDEPDFCACYRRELFDTPNIHPVGRVDVASLQFQALARTCAYVIHPSCSEGQAGAVAQGMHAGLIPLVTRESGIDTEDLGVTFAGDALEEIERVIRDVAGRPPEWHREHGTRSREAARSRYSAAAFEVRWREIVTALLGASG